MPAKKGKKKGKKKKGKKKLAGNETPDMVVKRFLKTYERNCAQSGTIVCPGLKSMLKEAIEKEALLVKLIIENIEASSPADPIISLDPLVMALRQERYIYFNDLHVWNLPLEHTDIASLALLLEKAIYPIRKIELMDCLVEANSLKRLAISFNPCESLTTVNFDYNEFGDEGCKGLCDGLVDNKLLLSISMCFCELTSKSGKILGNLINTTAVRELYLDGNDLGCEGAMEIIKTCADHAEVETFEREEEARRKAEEETLLAEMEKKYTSSTSLEKRSEEGKPASAKGKKKKKKGKKKKKKEPPPPPPVGPWIHRLHLADNGIDGYGTGGSFAPLICMRLFRKLITHSTCFEELDLEDNLIGDMGGRELIEGLQDRKEAKMDGVKLRTTHRMNSDTFNQLVKLGTGLKKKKKKGRKKKKK